MTKSKIIRIVYIIVLIAILIPYILSFRYVLPVGDDFSFYNNVIHARSKGWGDIRIIFGLPLKTYLEWQGTYFTNLLLYVFSMIGVRFGKHAIQLILFTVFALFVGTVSYLIKTVLANVFYDKRDISWCLASVGLIWLILNMTNPDEFFFWLTGVCAYTIPLIVAVWGIVCLISERPNYVLASVFGVLACGGTLACAGMVNTVFLSWGLFEYIKSKKKHEIIPFFCCFAGALINVASPGNYERMGRTESSLTMFNVLLETVQTVVSYLTNIMWGTYFVAVLVVVSIVVLTGSNTKDSKLKSVLWISFTYVVVCISCIFPVVMGYGHAIFPHRVIQLLSITVILGLFFSILCILQYVKQRAVGKGVINLKQVLILSILIVSLDVLGIYLKVNPQMPMDIMMTEIKNGKLEDAYLMGNWAYMIMQDSAGQDVVIDFLIPGTYQLMNVDLGDKDNWVNIELADFYNNKTVTYEPR